MLNDNIANNIPIIDDKYPVKIRKIYDKGETFTSSIYGNKEQHLESRKHKFIITL